jgi:hypothetical protein
MLKNGLMQSPESNTYTVETLFTLYRQDFIALRRESGYHRGVCGGFANFLLDSEL